MEEKATEVGRKCRTMGKMNINGIRWESLITEVTAREILVVLSLFRTDCERFFRVTC